MPIFPRERRFQNLLAELVRRQNSVVSEGCLLLRYALTLKYKSRLSAAAHTNESFFRFRQK